MNGKVCAWAKKICRIYKTAVISYQWLQVNAVSKINEECIILLVVWDRTHCQRNSISWYPPLTSPYPPLTSPYPPLTSPGPPLTSPGPPLTYTFALPIRIFDFVSTFDLSPSGVPGSFLQWLTTAIVQWVWPTGPPCQGSGCWMGRWLTCWRLSPSSTRLMRGRENLLRWGRRQRYSSHWGLGVWDRDSYRGGDFPPPPPPPPPPPFQKSPPPPPLLNQNKYYEKVEVTAVAAKRYAPVQRHLEFFQRCILAVTFQDKGNIQ